MTEFQCYYAECHAECHYTKCPLCSVMLNVIILNVLYVECRQSRYAKYNSAKCHYAGCNGSCYVINMFTFVMPSVILLRVIHESAVMLNVIILNVVAPDQQIVAGGGCHDAEID